MARQKPKDSPHPAEPAEPVDKAQQVLEELKSRSSEIVIRQAFRTFPPKPGGVTVDDITLLLDETVGLNGWEIGFNAIGEQGILCTIRVKVEGEWVSRSGIGCPNEWTAELHKKRTEAIDNAFFAAAKFFGIGRDKWKNPVAAAATPAAPTANGTAAPTKDKAPDKPKSKPTDKPTDKPTESLLADHLAEWEKKLSACDTPEELNDCLPALKNVPAAFRGEVWKFVQKWAKEDAHRWAYDPDKKSFFDPAPPEDPEPGDAIPF